MSRTDEHSNRRTELLVSVRDVSEALAALAGGADLVDVKEPERGALGRADDRTIEAIVRAVRANSSSSTTSAALGELVTDGRQPAWFEVAPDFVKVGLAGAARLADWRRDLGEWTAANAVPSLAAVEGRPCWVGVVYADWEAAGAPPPREVVEVALELGCAGVLVDTFDKRSGTLFEVMPAPELLKLADMARGRARFLALAGRLGVADLPRLRPLRPDIVAVRSAACRGGDRDAVVEASAVRCLRDAMESLADSRDPLVAKPVLPDAANG